MMWHGMAGADDNSFLVVGKNVLITNFTLLYKQGLSDPREQEMEIATAPSVQNDDERTFQQQKRVSRT